MLYVIAVFKDGKMVTVTFNEICQRILALQQIFKIIVVLTATKIVTFAA